MTITFRRAAAIFLLLASAYLITYTGRIELGDQLEYFDAVGGVARFGQPLADEAAWQTPPRGSSLRNDPPLRATIAEPGASLFGVSLGETRADVEVDVRATDIITGEVVVSMSGSGSAASPNIEVTRIPRAGRISYDDPTVGPLLAEAANGAITEVVAAIRGVF